MAYAYMGRKTYLYGSGYMVEASVVIQSPIYMATGVTPGQFAAILQNIMNQGTITSPNSGAIYGFGDAPSYEPLGEFPFPAVLGQPVYDAQISLHFQLTVAPTNMTLWLSEIKADLASNAAFLCASSNVDALLPFISIQSPAANGNPADFSVNSGTQSGYPYTLTFTLSAYITTVTGPYWTPDVLQQGFAYLTGYGEIGSSIFRPFTSGIAIEPLINSPVTDLPTYQGSTGSSQQCQFGYDAVMTFQATFTDTTVGSASTDEFIQLIQKDIAWMLNIAAAQDPATEDYDDPIYGTVSETAFLPYIQVVWPFLNISDPAVPVIESYGPDFPADGLMQPLHFKNASTFYVQFNLLANASCILNGFGAVGAVEDLFQNSNLSSQITPYAALQLTDFGKTVDSMPSTQALTLSGLPVCPSSVTPPSCNVVPSVPTSVYTYQSYSITFGLPLAFPITDGLDFAGKLQADIIASFALPSGVQASDLLPYIIVVNVTSSVMSHSVATFVIQGSVNTIGLSSADLAAAFTTQASMGNLSLPSVAHWYGVSVPTQNSTVVGVGPAAPPACQAAYDATVTFQAMFTNTTVGTANSDTFIQAVAVDITQQLASAVINLSPPGTEITTTTLTELATTFSITWPFMLAVADKQVVTTFGPSQVAPFSPFSQPADWFYVRFNLFANATCVFGGLSAMSVAQAFFNNQQNSTYISTATQLLVSTTGLQVQQSLLTGELLCSTPANNSCPALPTLPVTISNVTTSSSTGSLSSSPVTVTYPAGSITIEFYVIVSSISDDALFAVLIEQDIALNLANITGLPQAELQPFIVVTNINGTAVVNAGFRRLLQSQGPHTSISFVLLASVSSLSTASVTISASSVDHAFSQKAQQGALQTPNSGASAPAQTVSSSAVAASSSSSSTGSSSSSSSPTGYGATNGAHTVVSGASVCSMLVALIAAVSLSL